jgi:hypothetical protein
MSQKLNIIFYALIILLILVLPSQADEYCTTEDMCAAAAQAAGKMLGNEGKNGITGYPFVLETNTYGCWYYPDSHANKNYAGSAFWGAASSEAEMTDPDPGDAHHVRLKCGVANAAPAGFCTTEDTCAAAAEAEGLKLGNKRGNSGYPFVLETNTYGCWYYPDSHANKNYAGSAFWGAASSEAEMTDPDPGDAHHVRLKCEGGGPAQTIMEEAPVIAAEAQAAAEVDQEMTEEQAKEAAVAQTAEEAARNEKELQKAKLCREDALYRCLASNSSVNGFCKYGSVGAPNEAKRKRGLGYDGRTGGADVGNYENCWKRHLDNCRSFDSYKKEVSACVAE